MVSCLLLTAGIGSRLDPITRLVAKPAVPFGDRTLVEHVLAWLQRRGIRDVVLNLHALPSTITRVVGDGAHLGLSVRYSWEDPILGSAGGPRRALSLLESDPILIVNGDVLCDFDLAPMLAAHHARRAEVTMALIPNPAPDRYNGVLLDGSDAVVGFAPRGTTTSNWHFIGPQLVNRSVFAGLPDGQPAETVAGLYRDMLDARPGAIRGWAAPSQFQDVGTARDYLDAASMSSVTSSHPRITRSIVWPGARIGKEVSLDRCIVAGDIDVPDGTRESRRIIVPASIVRSSDVADVRGDIALFPIV